MNPEEEIKIKTLVKEYSDIFHTDEDLTFTNQIKHKIRTTNEIPVYTKAYRYPQIHKQEVQNQICDMLKQKNHKAIQLPMELAHMGSTKET